MSGSGPMKNPSGEGRALEPRRATPIAGWISNVVIAEVDQKAASHVWVFSRSRSISHHRVNTSGPGFPLREISERCSRRLRRTLAHPGTRGELRYNPPRAGRLSSRGGPAALGCGDYCQIRLSPKRGRDRLSNTVETKAITDSARDLVDGVGVAPDGENTSEEFFLGAWTGMQIFMVKPQLLSSFSDCRWLAIAFTPSALQAVRTVRLFLR